MSILDNVKELMQPVETPQQLEILDVVWHVAFGLVQSHACRLAFGHVCHVQSHACPL